MRARVKIASNFKKVKLTFELFYRKSIINVNAFVGPEKIGEISVNLAKKSMN